VVALVGEATQQRHQLGQRRLRDRATRGQPATEPLENGQCAPDQSVLAPEILGRGRARRI
jgi:hypothetical protein